MKTVTRLLFVAVILITVMVRLYKVGEPIADWHSFRQVDTASVARIYQARGIDLLHPRYHDLSNIQSGKDNPEGWRMVELPLYQAAGVLVSDATRTPIDVSLRYVTIAAAAGTAAVIMLIGFCLGTPAAALVSGLVYAVLPYSIYYGRTVLPETFAVFWAMLSLYLLMRTGSRKHGAASWSLLTVSAISASLAVLVKPTAAFLLVPVPYILFRAYGMTAALAWRSVVFGAISLVPFFWWRQWISQFPEGIPAFDWLLNKGNIRFKGAWFEWLFAQRLGSLILGYWGVLPFGIGLIMRPGKKEGLLYPWLALGGLIYMSVFAAGNVQHDYYQIILLPIVSLCTGRGLVWLIGQREFHPLARTALVGTVAAFTFAFSWYTIRTYYWINRPEIIEAGKAADALLPKDAKVIAPYNGDTTFLYQTGRVGWPLGFDIDKKLAAGATHYVTVSPTDADFETKTLAEQYTVLVRNGAYAIIDLTKPR